MEVTFLGASIDVSKEATSIGIREDSTFRIKSIGAWSSNDVRYGTKR